MISDVTKNIQRSNLLRVQAGNEVTRVIKRDFAVSGNQLTIDSRNDLAVGKI